MVTLLTNPKPKQLTSIIQLAPAPAPTLEDFEVLLPFVPDDQGQHIVQEYMEGYALLTVRDIVTDEILCTTDQFLLTGINESDQERFSMGYTLGDPVLRGGRGRRPKMFAYTGMLVDSEKDGSGIFIWRSVYEDYLRASSCVNLFAIIEFTFRDQYRKGYMTSCTLQYDANHPQRAGLMFTMFVIGVDRAKS